MVPTPYEAVYIPLYFLMIPINLSGNDPDVLSEMMNKELCQLFKWLKANKLSLDAKKHVTGYIFISIQAYICTYSQNSGFWMNLLGKCNVLNFWLLLLTFT